MKTLVLIILLITVVMALPLSSSATENYLKESIRFSVDSIRNALEKNYRAMPSCRDHNFHQMAEDTYHSLKESGKGHSVYPMDCGGRQIKFHNNGNNFLDLIIREEVENEAQQ